MCRVGEAGSWDIAARVDTIDDVRNADREELQQVANVGLYEVYSPGHGGFYAIEAVVERLAEDREASYNAVAGGFQCSRPAVANAMPTSTEA